jgi:Fe-S-cluster containining protein
MTVDRKALCPCGSGRRYKSCCYSKDRARDDVLDTARESHRRIDEVLKVLLPLVESRGEYKVACQAGCNACCVTFVRITETQAALLATWLLQPENAWLLDRYEAWLPRWREAIGPEVAVIERILAEHGGVPADATIRQEYLDANDTYARRRLMCPFNDDAGNCAIYPVRPMPCRTWNVVGTSANCGPDPKEPPVAISHPVLGEAIRDARKMLDGAAERAAQPKAERAMMNALEGALSALRRP